MLYSAFFYWVCSSLVRHHPEAGKAPKRKKRKKVIEEKEMRFVFLFGDLP